MISLTSKGHYKVTTPGGATVGNVEGDHLVRYVTTTADGDKLGPFPTLEEALVALNSEHTRPA